MTLAGRVEGSVQEGQNVQVILRTYQAPECSPRIADESDALYPLDTPVAKLLADQETDKQPYHFSLAEISEHDLCKGLCAATQKSHYAKWQANIRGSVLRGGEKHVVPAKLAGRTRVIVATTLPKIDGVFSSKDDSMAVLFPAGNTIRDLLTHREMSRQAGVEAYFYLGAIDEAHLCQGLTAASMGDVHTKWEVAIQATLLAV